jgi:hypothetical protein
MVVDPPAASLGGASVERGARAGEDGETKAKAGGSSPSSTSTTKEELHKAISSSVDTLDNKLFLGGVSELSYLTHIVIRLFELPKEVDLSNRPSREGSISSETTAASSSARKDQISRTKFGGSRGGDGGDVDGDGDSDSDGDSDGDSGDRNISSFSLNNNSHFENSAESNAVMEQVNHAMLDVAASRHAGDDGEHDENDEEDDDEDDDDDDDDDHKQRVDEHEDTGARFQVVIEFSAGCRQVPIGPMGRENADTTPHLLQSHTADTLDGEVEIKTWRSSEHRVEKLEILHTTSLDNFEEMLQNLLSKVKYATMADEWNVRRVRPLFNKKQNSLGNRSSRDPKVAPKGSPHRSDKRNSSRPTSPVVHVTPSESKPSEKN